MEELPEVFTDGIWQRFTRQCELAEMPAEVKEEYISTMTTEIDRRAQKKYEEKEMREYRQQVKREVEEKLREVENKLREVENKLREGENKLREEERKLREGERKLREEMIKDKMALREEGRTEGSAELIRTMFSNGMDVAEIARVTGLTVGRVDGIVNVKD